MTVDLTLLIADDDPLLREVLYEQLSKLCSHIVLATDGAEAVEMLSKHTIGVALLDLRMPKLSGIEVLKVFRDQSPDTVCIMLTGCGEAPVIKESLKAGAYDFVEKPYSRRELEQVFARACEKAVFQRERREFLEYLVCELGNVALHDFRKLSQERQAKLFSAALGVFKMKFARHEMSKNT